MRFASITLEFYINKNNLITRKNTVLLMLTINVKVILIDCDKLAPPITIRKVRFSALLVVVTAPPKHTHRIVIVIRRASTPDIFSIKRWTK